MNENTNLTYSGFAALVGKPNAGKSTLINALVGEKVSIVSDKPQTTRNRLAGFITENGRQLVLIDTPGIHKPVSTVGKFYVESAVDAMKESDFILWVADASSKPSQEDERVASYVKRAGTECWLILNKVDKLKDANAIDRAEKAYTDLFSPLCVKRISALKGDGVDALKADLFNRLQPGPLYYPEDEFTDQKERFLFGELIREKVFNLTADEIPHCSAVGIEEVKFRDNGMLYIRATIYVERESQKPIMIGENGKMLKAIGQEARKSIEELMDQKVYIDLWVKVKQNWREKEFFWRELGIKG